MKYLRAAVILTLVSLLAGICFQLAVAQQPPSQSSETVAKPKKKDAPAAADADEPNAASIAVLENLGMQRSGREVTEGRPLLLFELRYPRS